MVDSRHTNEINDDGAKDIRSQKQSSSPFNAMLGEDDSRSSSSDVVDEETMLLQSSDLNGIEEATSSSRSGRSLSDLVEQSKVDFADGFGGKTIGKTGSFSLLLNNVCRL